MAHHMTYDDLKYEQESQRGGRDTPYSTGQGPDLDRPESHAGGGVGSTKGKCLHCEQPGHQWRACQWRCNHCGTYEHSHVPRMRASTQCPALIAKAPRIYEQHNYRHTTDRGNAVGRAEDVAELSNVLERFMQGLRRENEGLRDDLIRSQRYADLLERDLRETRERFWEERDIRAQAEDELKDEDVMREETQQAAPAPVVDPAAMSVGRSPGQTERLRRLQVQRQRRTRRYQADLQRRANEPAGYQIGGHIFHARRQY